MKTIALLFAACLVLAGCEEKAPNEPTPKGTSAKEIEVFGDDYAGKVVEMYCRFASIDNTCIRISGFDDEKVVGFCVYDKTGELFQNAFADKESFGRILLGLKRGEILKIYGGLIKTREGFFLMAVEIKSLGNQ